MFLASFFFSWMLPWRAIMMRWAWGEPAPCIFDEKMQAHLVDCDYEAQTVTYTFPTQRGYSQVRSVSAAMGLTSFSVKAAIILRIS